MNPDDTFRALRSAMRARRGDEARQAALDLKSHLNAGGSYPKIENKFLITSAMAEAFRLYPVFSGENQS